MTPSEAEAFYEANPLLLFDLLAKAPRNLMSPWRLQGDYLVRLVRRGLLGGRCGVDPKGSLLLAKPHYTWDDPLILPPDADAYLVMDDWTFGKDRSKAGLIRFGYDIQVPGRNSGEGRNSGGVRFGASLAEVQAGLDAELRELGFRLLEER